MVLLRDVSGIAAAGRDAGNPESTSVPLTAPGHLTFGAILVFA